MSIKFQSLSIWTYTKK